MKRRGFPFIVGYWDLVRVGDKVRYCIYDYTGTIAHRPGRKGKVGVIWNFNNHVTWIKKELLDKVK